VELLSASFNEVREKLSGSTLWTSVLRFGCRSDHLTKVCLLISGEKVRNFTSVQDIVDIFEETFFLDLSISEDE